MDTDKLIPLQKRGQIIAAIENAAPFGGEVWQTNASGRLIMQIIQMHIEIKYDKLIFRTPGTLEIDILSPLFIRLSYRSLIFRLEPGKFKIMGDKVICDYPEEAQGLELRSSERYVLPINSDISLSIKRKIRTLRETVFEIEVRIVDVSEYGFGLLISGGNRDFLRRFDSCWIKAVDHNPLSLPLSARVTYVAPKGYYMKKGEVRVGLALATPLTAETFEYLKTRSRLVLNA
ncbi:MAG TPA: hypothetical protein VNJ08_12310 [Bacteriovoracaceae bacterium]|nr:hypothetical protein [Bacteriovoracaceae bacterium]